VSAVPVPSALAAASAGDLERVLRAHPWIDAVRVDSPSLSGVEAWGMRLAVVPSRAGVEALRAHGKGRLVEACRSRCPVLPAEIRSWRLVRDLDDASNEASYCGDRANVQGLSVTGDDALHARLWVPYDLRVFDGHFASVPLVPGMVQVAWVLRLAREHLGHTGRLRGLGAVKFRRLVRPGMELEVTLQWSAPRRELQFQYRCDATTISLGRLNMSGCDD
jgi:hypothetical protein